MVLEEVNLQRYVTMHSEHFLLNFLFIPADYHWKGEEQWQTWSETKFLDAAVSPPPLLAFPQHFPQPSAGVHSCMSENI